jgi:hypothetical protein
MLGRRKSKLPAQSMAVRNDFAGVAPILRDWGRAAFLRHDGFVPPKCFRWNICAQSIVSIVLAKNRPHYALSH